MAHRTGFVILLVLFLAGFTAWLLIAPTVGTYRGAMVGGLAGVSLGALAIGVAACAAPAKPPPGLVCGRCEYPVRGLAPGTVRCPECGASLSEAMTLRRRWRWHQFALLVLFGGGGMLLALLSLVWMSVARFTDV